MLYTFLEIMLRETMVCACQVASATATFVMMFSSSLSVVEFYFLGRFPIPYGKSLAPNLFRILTSTAQSNNLLITTCIVSSCSRLPNIYLHIGWILGPVPGPQDRACAQESITDRLHPLLCHLRQCSYHGY